MGLETLDAPLTIAVAKGYLWEEAKKRLTSLGVEFETDFSTSRKLYSYDKGKKIKVLMVRSWDVPTYVEEGAADLGIVGKDVLLEQEPRVCDLLDLGFGGCSLVLAGLEKITVKDLGHNIKVATKYTNSTDLYFKRCGLKIEPIKLYGAIELAPHTGIADIICDLTATGSTLKENGLHIIDTVYTSTAHLIANPVSMKRVYSSIVSLTKMLA
ncbi:ATP phosphoribosyltransferase [Candidatus Marinamargulisbacteria bacterium SCGC AG-439-L15]|nr:ATP phosphoribosyltransferase [Candidatus Marinamargulisbacteria bacterium SCGC AG-439-L15]